MARRVAVRTRGEGWDVPGASLQLKLGYGRLPQGCSRQA